MKSNVKDMTQGNPLKLILLFALPLMAGNIFQQLYTVVDTMVVGKALGVGALAALGATDWFYWLVLGMVQGVTQGFAILMSKEFGARDYESLRKVVGISSTLSGLCALALTGISLLVSPAVLGLLNTPAAIMDTSLLYLRTLLCGLPIVMIYNLLACILRSLGDGRTPLIAMVVASLTNIGLDVLFVFGFRWGVVGAAVATLIAQGASSIFCFIKLRKIDFMALKPTHFKPEAFLSWRLFGLGTPMALQNAIIAVGGMILQGVVNGFGVAFIGGFTATNKLYGILEIAAISYGYSMITYAGQNLGAKRPDRIRKGMRYAILVAMITSVVIAAFMLIFGTGIIASFLSGTPEEVAEATKVGYDYLTVMSLGLPILYVLHVTRSTVQGMGNTVLPMGSGIAEFVMRTGSALLLPGFIGSYGIFLAEVLAWVGADLILIPSYFVTVKKLERQLDQ
ncbi:MAG: MATE family efflux transporter [Clostridia bacterium]|nr:MATE family efflux transporter [Clostridia bacterium]MBQ4623229.1 MATE family efflux transporter [Clostridia bacterium]